MASAHAMQARGRRGAAKPRCDVAGEACEELLLFFLTKRNTTLVFFGNYNSLARTPSPPRTDDCCDGIERAQLVLDIPTEELGERVERSRRVLFFCVFSSTLLFARALRVPAGCMRKLAQ